MNSSYEGSAALACPYAAEVADLRVIVNVAKRWAAFQHPDSLADQVQDQSLMAEARQAERDLIEAVEALS